MATVSPEKPWSYTLNLPHDPRSARIARITLRGVLSSHALHELVDEAELLTSELVTNAYRYSDGPAELHVRETPRGVRITVWDTNPDVPAPFGERPGAVVRAVEAEATYGRGLLIVRVCADNWGSHAFGGPASGPGFRGKLLWCELGAKSTVARLAA
ncbi:ATP-binding protein [Streptomyces sp. ISL-11]|uniref:ATP-binding protein n=1 Tax=Streptomyces sp. ISL-11 TaxID=2819174 RepID=UPI001BEC99BD|nr:ATP-binding protein [Streptomyces sp. ISL-11]MBT2382443.1 ATP-binding protein [Streptomyces sp. ISL-11]